MTNYDISEDPVFGLGYAGTSIDIWSNSGFNYEWAIAGKPFLSIASDEFQSIRSFVQVNKQQFDNKDDPGEQTLTGWWLRSQRDFGCGAGQSFFEPTHTHESAQDSRIMRRFYTSRGVDVWTPGEASLLPSMSQVFSASGDTDIVSADYNNTSYVYGLTGTGVKRWNGTTVQTITGWTATPTALASTGDAVLAFHSTGIDISYASGTTVSQLYTHSLGVGDGWFVKERIIAAFGSSLYELPLAKSSGSAPWNIGTSDLIYDPGSGWTWTSAVAAPGAILVSGYRGSRSAIYSFTVKANGDVDALTAPVTVAELPNGEIIRGMRTYLGAYIILATSSGVRVGTIGNDGVGGASVTYGPLSYTGTAYGDIAAYDRFAYVGVADAGNGTAGCIRIDLSEIDQYGRAAWANDVDTGVTGEVDAVYMFGTTDRVIIGVNNQGVYASSTTQLVSSGELVTSKIRYSTLEPKTFQFAAVKGDTVNGNIVVQSIDVSGGISNLYTMSASSTSEFGFPSTEPSEYVSLKFTLNRDSGDATKGPVLRGWQTKALPAVKRKQQWRLPLMCFDMEQDRFGNKSGFTGNALARYQSLRAALINGIPILIQDLIAGESYTVLVEDVEFYQTSPPHNASGFGGVAIVQCREL